MWNWKEGTREVRASACGCHVCTVADTGLGRGSLYHSADSASSHDEGDEGDTGAGSDDSDEHDGKRGDPKAGDTLASELSVMDFTAEGKYGQDGNAGTGAGDGAGASDGVGAGAGAGASGSTGVHDGDEDEEDDEDEDDGDGDMRGAASLWRRKIVDS